MATILSRGRWVNKEDEDNLNWSEEANGNPWSQSAMVKLLLFLFNLNIIL